MSAFAATANGHAPVRNPWLVATAVILAASMEVLDATIVNVALPHIAGTTSSSYDQATWVLTSYLVSSCIMLPLSAFLGRRFGRKRYFLACIIGFTLSSLLCGLAAELWQLVLFRILQGLFGGGLLPTAQAIILDAFEPSQRGKAFSASGMAIVVAPILGPTLGGWITDTFSWRWVFLINIPVGLVLALAVSRVVDDPPWLKEGETARARVDYTGIALIALGLGCLQVTLDRGQDADWFSSSFIFGMALLAALGLAGAVGWLLRTQAPVINLRCLGNLNFALGCTSVAGFAFILYASEIMIPKFAQQQLGYSATLAGLVLSPGAVAIVLMIPLVIWLMGWMQTRYVLACGFLMLGTALAYSTRLVAHIDYETLVLMRTAQSVAIGFLFVPTSTLTYLTLPRKLNGDGAALFTMFLNVAGSMGISLSNTAVAERTQVHIATLSEHATPYSEPYQSALQSIAQALADAGTASGEAAQGAVAYLHHVLLSQAATMANNDVFAACAILAWVLIPLTFLFPPVKAQNIVIAH